MRKELYKMLCERLKEVGGGAIRHIDLWNHYLYISFQLELM